MFVLYLLLSMALGTLAVYNDMIYHIIEITVLSICLGICFLGLAMHALYEKKE